MIRQLLARYGLFSPLPPIMDIVGVITLGQTPEQIHQQKIAEAALANIQDAIMEIHAAAVAIGLDLESDLHKIVGKTYAKRRRIARDVYVKTALEQ